MAITLDTILNKTFNDAKNGYGYDKNEVEDFLDEILEEMENREAQTNQLKEQAAALSRELDETRAQLAARPAAQVSSMPAKHMEERHATESFELVLSKAKGAYEEIVSAADARADEIIRKATEEASSIRSNAEGQIADLTAKLGALRRQTGNYCDALRKMLDEQNASMDQIKKLL